MKVIHRCEEGLRHERAWGQCVDEPYSFKWIGPMFIMIGASFYIPNQIYTRNVGMYGISSIHVTCKLNGVFCLISYWDYVEDLKRRKCLIFISTKLATQSKEPKKVQAINANCKWMNYPGKPMMSKTSTFIRHTTYASCYRFRKHVFFSEIICSLLF